MGNAPKQRSREDGGIVFGTWKLFPLDARNWELCRLRERDDGTRVWRQLGRYYQYNTIGEALRYAADMELKEHHEHESASIGAALMEYEDIAHRLMDELKRN